LPEISATVSRLLGTSAAPEVLVASSSPHSSDRTQGLATKTRALRKDAADLGRSASVTQPQPSDADARLRAVQQLWSTYREAGAATASELLHEDVVFVTAEGETFEGRDGVRAFFSGFVERGEHFIASPFTFELHEPDVLVVGHRRVRGPGSARGDYLYFVHGFRDGQVCRLTAHTSREAALMDVERRRR
jgi:hypothetical protein